MTITTGYNYPVFSTVTTCSNRAVNIKHLSTNSLCKKSNDKNPKNDCSQMCTELFQCLENNSYNYGNEFACLDLALKFKKCITSKPL
jgi:hypothetical protein